LRPARHSDFYSRKKGEVKLILESGKFPGKSKSKEYPVEIIWKLPRWQIVWPRLRRALKNQK